MKLQLCFHNQMKAPTKPMIDWIWRLHNADPESNEKYPLDIDSASFLKLEKPTCCFLIKFDFQLFYRKIDIKSPSKNSSTLSISFLNDNFLSQLLSNLGIFLISKTHFIADRRPQRISLLVNTFAFSNSLIPNVSFMSMKS